VALERIERILFPAADEPAETAIALNEIALNEKVKTP